MLLTPAQIKPKSFELRWNFFFTQGGCASCLHACLGARLLPQSYQYPNLSEGADCVSGQLRGDKECSFCGITKSGRVWRKVLESDARSVSAYLCNNSLVGCRWPGEIRRCYNRGHGISKSPETIPHYHRLPGHLITHVVKYFCSL